MKTKRRDFIKKALLTTAVATTSVFADDDDDRHNNSSGRVPRGEHASYKSKPELMYKKTQNWSDYYKSAKYHTTKVSS